MSPGSAFDNPYLKWPNDWDKIENRLDVGAIEAAGNFYLHRALNTNRLIGFVGSGLSMAYGRVSWGELVVNQVEIFVGLFKINKNIEKYCDAECKYIQDLYSSIQRDPKIKGDSINVGLDACERLWIRISDEKFDGDHGGFQDFVKAFGFDWEHEKRYFRTMGLNGSDRGKFLYRKWIKHETYDERAYVRRLLDGYQTQQVTAKDSSAKERARAAIQQWLPTAFGKIPGIEAWAESLLEDRELKRKRETYGAPEFHRFFSLEFLELLRDWGQQFLQRLPLPDPTLIETAGLYLKIVDLCIEQAAKPGCLYPVRRFAVGLALDIAKLLEQLDPNVGQKIDLAGVMAEAVPKVRADIIAPGQDPLRHLAYELKLRRFVTTNYDLEIERLFEDFGYRPETPTLDGDRSSDETVSADFAGGRARDLVLNPKTAADLVDFAVSDSLYDFQVVHMHGRATDDQDVIVTEADYQRLYVAPGQSLTTLKEGIDITFGGNPVLFVGLGLSEGDIMRPLREFMTDISRRNRSIIALRNGSDSRLEQETFVTGNYRKYGVHVLHFGNKSNLNTGTPEASWLHDLSGELGVVRNHISSKTGIKSTFDEAGLLKIFGDFRDFRSDNAVCDVEFEIKIIALLPKIRDLVHAATTKPGAKGKAKTKADGSGDNRLLKFSRLALIRALERGENAVLTAALNAKLAAIKEDWTEWWKDWRREPRTRGKSAQFQRLVPNQSIWGRYVLGRGPGGNEILTPTARAREVADTIAGVNRKDGERYIFVISGARGAGKGSLFAGLIPRLNDPPSKIKYRGQLFLTFSFSTEVASVWDSLLGFLLNPDLAPGINEQLPWFAGEKPPGGTANQPNSTLEAYLRLPRTDALRRAMMQLAGKDMFKAASERLLIVINAFDILLGENGHAKNSEISRILDFLLGPDGANSPIDIVLFCRDERLPHRYRLGQPQSAETRGHSHSIHVAASDTSTPLYVLLSEYSKTRFKAAENPDRNDMIQYGDFSASMRRSHLNLRLPEEVQFPWLVKELHPGVNPDELSNANIAEEDRRNFVFHVQIPQLEELNWEYFANNQFDIFKNQKVDIKDILESAKAVIKDTAKEVLGNTDHRIPEEPAVNRLFFEYLERRVFLYTLLIAISFALYAEILPSHKHGDVYDLEGARVAAQARLKAFLKNLMLVIRVPGIQVEDRVIAAVLEFWSEFRQTDGGGVDPHLATSVLRHLAIIGTPAGVDVLLLCPRIAVFLKDESDKWGTLETALEALAVRGLISELTGEEKSRRYIVHRAIQRYFFRKLGAQSGEPAGSQLFTVSLFGAQLRVFPRLNDAGYEFVYELVRGLAAYPSDQVERQLENLNANGLRAAMAVTRRLFSHGVVSRLSDFNTLNIAKPSRVGYFEHHRLIIRWLLHAARHLIETDGAVAPFYRDEFIWLANEIGVFSLSQGQIYDASAFLWMARRAARDIERGQTGVLRSRILLNEAWCCIDRARLGDAEKKLNEVRAIAEEEQLLKVMARGALARVYHVHGLMEMAQSEYEATIRELEDLKRASSLALIHRYFGDFKRHMGEYDEADTELLKALQLAESANCLDLVHHIQVSRVRNEINTKPGEYPSLMKRLDDAHAYAQRMELNRLLCDTLAVKAEIYIRQTQADKAGENIARAIRVATLSGLTLRKTAYLEILGRVEALRGNTAASDRLMRRTLMAARRSGYNLIVERVERIREIRPIVIPQIGVQNHS